MKKTVVYDKEQLNWWKLNMSRSDTHRTHFHHTSVAFKDGIYGDTVT